MRHDALSFWPRVGDSESLYSVAAAIHHCRGNVSHRTTGLFLFADDNAASRRQFPSNLEHFCKVTGGRLGDPETVLKERTILGLHMRFMSQADAGKLVILCLGHRNKGVKFRSPDTKLLRYCPDCVREDRALLGRGTWRMEHQLPGALVCMDHGIDLSMVTEANPEKRHAWLRVDEFASDSIAVKTQSEERLWWQALAQILWVLHVHNKVSPWLLRHVLAHRLAELRIIPAARFLNSKSVAAWLKTQRGLPFWYADLVALEGDWLLFLDGRGAHHPLRWAVLFAATMTMGQFNLQLCNAFALQATIEGDWELAGQEHEDLLPRHVWDALLEGLPVPEVQERWGFPAASLNRALRLNPRIKTIRDEKIHRDLLLSRRAWVLDFVKNEPGARRIDLLLADSAKLRWLDLHDRDWLLTQLPLFRIAKGSQQALFAC